MAEEDYHETWVKELRKELRKEGYVLGREDGREGKEETLSNAYEKMWPELIDDKTSWKMFFAPSMSGRMEFVPKLLGDAIMQVTYFKTIKGSDKMYRYSDGYYVDDGREWIKKVCKKLLFEQFKAQRVNETINYIQASTYVNSDAVNSEWLNLENGLLNINTREFREHSPHVFSITRIPILYDPEAGCPYFKEKLAEKLSEEAMTVLQEMFGYCYMPGQRHEVAFLFYGPKRTMKSTVLFLLGEMLGEDNITAFPLQQLTVDHFSSAYLFGKLANICADLDSEGLRNTGKFMMITGGDKITAGKKHEHHISFFPSAKLIFSCNTIPTTSNKDSSFYRRWIILPFKRQTPKEQIDPYMKEKLCKEMAGILNWALEGLARLHSNKKFSYWLTEEEIKDLYEKSSDSISSFIYNEIDTENDEGAIKKRDVYRRYVEYCESNRLQKENVIKFGRIFIALTGCGICKKDGIPAYSGVNFKDTTYSVEEVMELEKYIGK